MIDMVERPNKRNLVESSIDNVVKLSVFRSENRFSKLKIGMHVLANSCTIMRFDNVIYLIPYTNNPGSKSPKIRRERDTKQALGNIFCEINSPKYKKNLRIPLNIDRFPLIVFTEKPQVKSGYLAVMVG